MIRVVPVLLLFSTSFQTLSVQAAPPTGKTPVREVVFVAFDVETTGFSAERDRVVEIGAVKMQGGRILEEVSWLVHPGRPIPPVATRVHGISDGMVEDAPAFAEVAPDIAAFMSGSVLVAHNARFDVGFLGAEFRRAGLRPPRARALDSLPLFRRWFPDAPSHSLGMLMKTLDLDAEGYHRAGLDARYAAMILAHGLKNNRRIKTLNDLKRAAGGYLDIPR